MLNVKLFEIRDRGTFIPALAILMCPEGLPEAERWLLRRAGYAPDSNLVLLTRLTDKDGTATYDPYCWHGSRTMGYAHLFVTEHWADLESGAIIDVEFILKERSSPKESERLEYGEIPILKPITRRCVQLTASEFTQRDDDV